MLTRAISGCDPKPTVLRTPRVHPTSNVTRPGAMTMTTRSAAERNFLCRDSESAISILFSGETKPRSHFNEVYVQALVSSTKFAKAFASKIFKVYSPALFVRGVGCEVMLGDWRPRAYSRDVLSDLNGQIVYMIRVPRIILIYGAAFGNGRGVTAKQKAKRQQ